MVRNFTLSDFDDRMFQASLILAGLDEQTALETVVKNFSLGILSRLLPEQNEESGAQTPMDIEKAMNQNEKVVEVNRLNPEERWIAFMEWMSHQKKQNSTELYAKGTIEIYAAALKNGLKRYKTHEIPVRNFFVFASIEDLESFFSANPDVLNFVRYSSAVLKSALKKYIEFL